MPQIPSIPSQTGPAVHLRVDWLDYGSDRLFEGLDCHWPAGQWTCLLGPSGVGKSTLLRLAAGLPTGGASGPDTKVTCGEGLPLDGRFAHMAQHDGLLPWLSVLDNVLIGPRLRGAVPPEARERARELLAAVGLADRAGDRPEALSGGMRQRTALVRTLVEDRPIVLMDEPFSALDPPTRLRLGDLAAGLLTGRTVILVTHDPLEALRLGHRVEVLAGRPARPGAPLIPDGLPPRSIQDPAVRDAHARLLADLAEAVQ